MSTKNNVSNNKSPVPVSPRDDVTSVLDENKPGPVLCGPFGKDRLNSSGPYEPSAPGTGVKLSENSFLHPQDNCAMAKHLSEVCFISAETLILLLGRLNKTEAQLALVLQTLVNVDGSLQNFNCEKDYKPPNSLLAKQDKTASLKQKHSTSRIYQPQQLVLNLPRSDICLWKSKRRILTSLSELLNCNVPVSALEYFYFLPSYYEYERIFLSFRTLDLAKKLLQASDRLRRSDLSLSRVFKDTEIKNKGSPTLKVQAHTLGSEKMLSPAREARSAHSYDQDHLLILKNK